jgi:hypothetical protein
VHTDVYPALSETSNKGILEPPFVDNDYKNMEAALYAYSFGTISFLELLAIFERTLNVTPSNGSSETEVVDRQ